LLLFASERCDDPEKWLKKEEGRRKKEEGRRKRKEGRRKREEVNYQLTVNS